MSKYDGRKQNFIRKYAKANNISESESREFFRKVYEPSSDAQRRKIMNDTKNKIKEKYPSKHPAEDRDTRGFKMPKQKGVKQKPRENIAYREYKGKQIPRSYNKTTIKRVESAQIKYPNASNYELRHGVNSKASQNYRVRHGGNRIYK